MTALRRVLLLLAVFAATVPAAEALLILMRPIPALADEPQAFFSISSDRTYAPGEKPHIQMWGRGVSALEFRVYRVNDPVKFFEQLRDPHQFGGKAPELHQETSWVERFHDWKHEWRSAIRDCFRWQYTAESRETIRDWWMRRGHEEVAKGATTTEFADVPVLNPNQLVARWRQPVGAPPHAGYWWESATVPVDVPGKGLYLVEAAGKGLRAYTILSVSELGLIVKTWPGHMLAFAQKRTTGEPVPGASLVFLANGKRLASLSAGADGLAETPVEGKDPEDVVVLARAGDDFAPSAVDSWQLNNDPESRKSVYIYTDRPVYRPGHTVYFKAILRGIEEGRYVTSQGAPVKIEIADPENKTVSTQTLSLSAAGTLQGKLVLPDSAALGYYSIRMLGRRGGDSGGFNVEEYKKPEYSVKVTTEVPRVLQGNPVSVTFDARYYFGEPVAGATVAWVVHRGRYWSPLFYHDEDSEDEEAGGEGNDSDDSGQGDSMYDSEQLSEQTGKLDANGRLTVKIPTSYSEKQRYDMLYRIEARVTDAANREISGHTAVVATYGSFLVNVTTDKYLFNTGETAHLTVEAKDYDGKPVATAVQIELRRSIYVDRGNEEPAPVTTLSAQTSADGFAKVDLPVKQAGSFTVRASARTPEGRQVEGRTWLWITGGGNWYGESREQVQIVPDKKSYAPGETAHVLILSGKPGAHLLVTTEGPKVYTQQVVAAAGSDVIVDVPIQAEFAPNININVAFLTDNRLLQGSKRVKIPETQHALALEITTSKPQYTPGEAATISVTARDSAGKPVRNAEVSIGVVDEAIYAVQPENVPDIFHFFYGSRRQGSVFTESSLSYYFEGRSVKQAMMLAGEGGGGGGERGRRALADVKPERLIEPKIRKAFPDTAYWNADVMTDAAGHAQVKFDFPDSLTTWRTTARAVTADTSVGGAVIRTIVRKNLMLRLATPRFFTRGDQAVLTGIVHNYLATEKQAHVSLSAQGLEILDASATTVPVPSRGEATVTWRVKPKPGDTAVLTAKALTDEESDGLELTLPIRPFGVRLSLSHAGSVTAAQGSASAELEFPKAIDPDLRMLEISVSPSVGGALFGALDFLTAYPYGCTEQTMSSFLPNVVVAAALRDLKVKSDVNEAELQKKIRAGLDRLYDFQHEDGGWGWWKTDESHAFMTAYVTAGLAQAKAAGVSVDQDKLKRGVTWLRGEYDRQQKAYPDLRAYLAYALALNGLAGADAAAVIDPLWEKRADMSPYGRAVLGLALDALHDDTRAGQIAAQLETDAKSDEQEAYWVDGKNYLLDFSGDSSAEATAYAMKLLVHYRPQSALLPKAALWLMNHRSEGFYWYSTEQTAMVVYGLTDYLKASGELKPDYDVSVTVNDKKILSRHFGAADAVGAAAPVMRLKAADLALGMNRVQFTKNGAGRLYWSARAEYFSTEEKLQRTGTVALNLLRDYFKLVPEHVAGQNGERIVYRLDPLNGPVNVGDVIAVRLTLTGDKWNYLAVEDPIPAGTEGLERDDLYELKEKPSWWSFLWARREFHDDRVALFINYFWKGQSTSFYLLKVVNPGTFHVSPAQVQPMYQPQYLSTTESRTVEVRAAEKPAGENP
ncbi:MAG TPA: MG2 domain-containing protein [Candidatus Acidoferrales bacterium]|nr:MG2 domain-containing protein [Candidatus Acidoferrales bacterium]